jgi:radical SAM protein with 4Fe4S-binding SPASM domain
MSVVPPYVMRVYVYTNGSLLQMFPFEEILGWHIDTLVVSVDGIDCESYERIRVGGRYQPLRDVVGRFYNWRNRLASRVPQIEIRHVIMPGESRKELLQFRKDWLDRADTVKFQKLIPLAPVSIPPRLPSQCRNIRRELCIEWDGRVRICGNYPEYFGDVHSATVEEIWRSSEVQFVRQCQKVQDFELIPACRECAPVGGVKKVC